MEQRFTGAEELLALDGLAGFLTAARSIGATIRADPEVWEDDYLLGLAYDHCGQEVVEQALGDASAVDQDIATYVRAVRELVAGRTMHPSTLLDAASLSYAEIAAWIARRGRNSGIMYLPSGDVPLTRHPCCWPPATSPSKQTQIAWPPTFGCLANAPIRSIPPRSSAWLTTQTGQSRGPPLWRCGR
jgi:hypothetical protein